jgi:hypothetical protein
MRRREFDAQFFAAHKARQPKNTAAKNIRRRGFLLLKLDLATIFHCSAIKNTILMPSPSSYFRMTTGRQGCKKYPPPGIFITQT